MTRTFFRRASFAFAFGFGAFTAALGCQVDDRELVDNLDTIGDGDGDGDNSGGTSGDGDGDASGGLSGDGDGDMSTGGVIGDGDGDLGTGGVIDPGECGVGDNIWINGWIGKWGGWSGHVAATVPPTTPVDIFYEGYDPVCLSGIVPAAQPGSPDPGLEHPSFIVDWYLNVIPDDQCQGDPQELFFEEFGIEVDIQNNYATPLMVVLTNDYTAQSWCAPLVLGGSVEAIPFSEFRVDCLNPGGDIYDIGFPVTRVSVVAQDQFSDTDVELCILAVRGVTRPFCYEPRSGCMYWADYDVEDPIYGDCVFDLNGGTHTFTGGSYNEMCGPVPEERDVSCTDADNTFEPCTPYGN